MSKSIYRYESEVQVVSTDIYKKELINDAGESVTITVEGSELFDETKEKIMPQIRLFTQMIRDILAESKADLF